MLNFDTSSILYRLKPPVTILSHSVFFLVLFSPLALAIQSRVEPEFPYQWIFIQQGLNQTNAVEDITRIVRAGAKSGYNGIVLSARLDLLSLESPAYIEKVRKVVDVCRDHHIDLIPYVLSAGYGDSILAYNKNLAAGMPVSDAVFSVYDRVASPTIDPKLYNTNGGFEDHQGHNAAGYLFQDRSGSVSFIDKQIVATGAAAMRFENFGRYEHGHGRICQDIRVKPRQTYMLSCRIKTDKISPLSRIKLQIHTRAGNYLTGLTPQVDATNDWKTVQLVFNAMDHTALRFYVGIWGGESGTFWIDDITVTRQQSLHNVLRRPGTPIRVRNLVTGAHYEEGKDFEPIVDRSLDFRWDHDAPDIRFLPHIPIKDGTLLHVSFFQGIPIEQQVAVCMSEPEVYRIWDRQVKLIHKVIRPRYYFLGMDEIRQGGGCRSCTDRNMSMARILGDCLTRQYGIIKAVNPEARMFTWSDMLDPHHNARNNYDMVFGDFTGSWAYVPKDLTIVCWHHQKRDLSLKHFHANGFALMAASFYEDTSLQSARDWAESSDHYNCFKGFMYSTWENNYDLLKPFRDAFYE